MGGRKREREGRREGGRERKREGGREGGEKEGGEESYNKERGGGEINDKHKQVLSPLSGECHLNPVYHRPSHISQQWEQQRMYRT